MNVIRSGGVEIVGLDSSKVARRKQVQEDPLLETYEFVPYKTSGSNDVDLNINLTAAIQIILQNVQGFIRTLKICTFSGDTSNFIEKIKLVIKTQPMVEFQHVTYKENDTNTTADAVLLTESILSDVQTAFKLLSDDGMILYQGDINKISTKDINIVYKATFGNTGLYLFRQRQEFPSKYSVVYVRNTKLDWLQKIQELIKSHTKEVVVLVSQDDDTSGIVGLMKCLLTEPNTPKFRCVLIQDEKAAAFSPDDEFYRNQLSTNLTFNVYRQGKWGTFVHLPLHPTKNKNVSDATVGILTVGDLSTLSWVERSSSYMK